MDGYGWIEMVLDRQQGWLHIYPYLLLEIGEMDDIDEMLEIGLHFVHLLMQQASEIII